MQFSGKMKTIMWGIAVAVCFTYGLSAHVNHNRSKVEVNRAKISIDELIMEIEYEKSKPIKPEIVVKSVESQVKTMLVDWVFANSHLGNVPKCSRKMAKEIVDAVFKTDTPLLLLAIFKKESRFEPTAVSHMGAMGLGQVMPMHEKWLKREGIITELRDLFDIETNIKASELVWSRGFQRAKGNPVIALGMYYGARDKSYSEPILSSYRELTEIVMRVIRGGE